MTDTITPEQIEVTLEQARFHEKNGTPVNPHVFIAIIEQQRAALVRHEQALKSLQEGNRYSGKMYDGQIKNLERQAEEQQKLIDHFRTVCPHVSHDAQTNACLACGAVSLRPIRWMP